MIDQHYNEAEEAASFDHDELTYRRADLLAGPNLVAESVIKICNTAGASFNEDLLFDQISVTVARHLASSLNIIEQEMRSRGMPVLPLNPGAEE